MKKKIKDLTDNEKEKYCENHEKISHLGVYCDCDNCLLYTCGECIKSANLKELAKSLETEVEVDE